ncbi:MAG: protein kinase domain-containing protein [Vicinamibacterales bacterium]
MSGLSWNDVEALFYETLAQPPPERVRFLAERCGSRQDLRAEVESLVRAHDTSRHGNVLDSPLPRITAPLTPGSSIGPYEVIEAIGSGGMGDVYRARDARLNRTVALKALRTDLVARSDLRARLKREAELLASLNHPHICTLYDVVSHNGSDYLVMEFVQGETLANRLASGPVPIALAVRLGHEIASALGRAHAHGIVHRDLKPANIALTRDAGGHAKLLDFGVAKLLSPASTIDGRGHAGATAAGGIVGTPRYMAPEQLEGAAVDHRADIFAFGAVLFEMLTAQPAFEGQSTASIIAAVLTHHPAAVSTRRTGVPPALDRVVRKCLAKDPNERWQSADDLASELKWIGESDGAVQAAPPDTRRRRLWWTGAAVAAAAIAGVAALVFTRADTADRSYRLSLVPPNGGTFVPGQPPMISPDGTTVALVVTDAAGRTRLHLRTLATGDDRAIDGTDQATLPFWSPDSTSLGFFAEGRLKTVDLGTSAIRTIADAPLGRGASWSRDNQIIFTPFNQDRLYLVSAFGGQTSPITTVDPTREFGHGFPEFLPDGRHFLYFSQSGRRDVAGTWVASLEGGPPRRLVAAGRAVLAPPNHLLFARGTSIFAQRFDVSRLELEGEPFFVTAAPGFLGRTLASVSTTGVLVAAGGRVQLRLALYDRAGREVRDLGEYAENPHTPILSPDGSRALLSFQADLWVVDINRGVLTRLTTTSGDDGFASWSPDGRDAIFASARTGAYAVWRKPVEPPGNEELVVRSERNLFPGSATAMSPDRRWLNVTGPSEGGSFDIYTTRLDGNGRLMPLVQSPFEERGGGFSPDGQWIAYVSNEAGGPLDVFVASFPDVQRKIRISTGGGISEQWSGRGDELFYIDQQGRLMAASIRRSEDRLEVGQVVPLFQTRLDVVNLPFFPRYSVSRDGQQFLMLTPSAGASDAATVILNWKGN